MKLGWDLSCFIQVLPFVFVSWPDVPNQLQMIVNKADMVANQATDVNNTASDINQDLETNMLPRVEELENFDINSMIINVGNNGRKNF